MRSFQGGGDFPRVRIARQDGANARLQRAQHIGAARGFQKNDKGRSSGRIGQAMQKARNGHIGKIQKHNVRRELSHGGEQVGGPAAGARHFKTRIRLHDRFQPGARDGRLGPYEYADQSASTTPAVLRNSRIPDVMPSRSLDSRSPGCWFASAATGEQLS